MAAHESFNVNDPDKELIDDWTIEAQFHVDDGADIVIRHARDNDVVENDSHILIHNGDTGDLLISSEVENDTQEGAIQRSVAFYRRVLGHLATSETLKSTRMNSTMILNTMLGPYYPDHVYDLDALAEIAQEEIELIQSAPEPPMLDMTSYVKAYLDSLPPQ